MRSHVIAAALVVGAASLAIAQQAGPTFTFTNSDSMTKLSDELVAAGVVRPGLAADGTIRVGGVVPSDPATLASITAVLAAHTDAPSRAQLLVKRGNVLQAALVTLAASKATAAEKTWAQGVIDAEYPFVHAALATK